MLSAQLTSRAPLALAHTTYTRQRGTNADSYAARWQKYTSPCTIRGWRRGTRSEEVDLAHVTSIRLGIRRFETRAACRAPRASSCRPQIGLFSSTDWSISQGLRGESRGSRYLNFKSANVYFCPGSRDCFAFRSSSRLSVYLSFSTVIGRLSPDALNFKFGRDHRVGRRGNNRLSSVSTRLCAVICFRRPPRSPTRLYVTDTAIYGAVSLVTSHFYLWRHPVCIRIDSVIYFTADSDAGPLPAGTKRRISRLRFDLLLLHFEHCVRRNNYVIIFSRLPYEAESVRKLVLEVRSRRSHNSRRLDNAHA